LDLSFQLWLKGIKLPSINEATVPVLDHKAIEQMSQALYWWVKMVVGTKASHGPVIFAKWDIKDGFWHLVVSEEDASHFCYILPVKNWWVTLF